MARHLAGIFLVFVCTTIAWMILGANLMFRTYHADAMLRGRVQSTWGAPHEQAPPTADIEPPAPPSPAPAPATNARGPAAEAWRPPARHLPLEQTRIGVGLDLEHRQKGLRWFSTYRVAFDGAWRFRNDTGRDQSVSFAFPFPAGQAAYDDLVFTVDGLPVAHTITRDTVFGVAPLPAGGTAVLRVAYRSQGLDRWTYRFGRDVAEARDFRLRMRTNFGAIDFPENTLSPTTRRGGGGGWDLTWSYRNLLSGYAISMVMPEHLQPGPLAGRISFFAPVSLFFFFFLMFVITTLRRIELHPMNYFFLAAAFFSFHLLLAYLADHVTMHLAFVICSAVSITLVVSYLRLAIGLRFALVEAGLAQLIYLVLFSYAFFFEGYTGLAVTIGSILTLFVVMQMTGRIRWAEPFQSAPGRGPVAAARGTE